MTKLSKFTLLAMLMFTVSGCQNEKGEEKKAYDIAYNSNYEGEYQKGSRIGAARGKREGEGQGQADAKRAANSGHAWQLYAAIAIGTLVLGGVVGLVTQYIILLVCRVSGHLPQLATVAFVPAMKSSFSYSIFERRRKFMVEFRERLSEIKAEKKLHESKIQAVHDAVAKKVMAVSSIEELTHARLLALAERELSEIVSASENKQNEQTRRISYRHTCPYCQQTVRYNDRTANKIVKCPNPKCGRSITLSSIPSLGHDTRTYPTNAPKPNMEPS